MIWLRRLFDWWRGPALYRNRYVKISHSGRLSIDPRYYLESDAGRAQLDALDRLRRRA